MHISIQEPNLVKSPTVWEMLLTNLDGRSLYAFPHVSCDLLQQEYGTNSVTRNQISEVKTLKTSVGWFFCSVISSRSGFLNIFKIKGLLILGFPSLIFNIKKTTCNGFRVTINELPGFSQRTGPEQLVQGRFFDWFHDVWESLSRVPYIQSLQETLLMHGIICFGWRTTNKVYAGLGE